ncbi:MAG: cytidine deaminase [Bacteroidetes bacterium]|nr:cytidine deaminase [Bacteroidota bacterium]
MIKNISIRYSEFAHWEELGPDDIELVKKAFEVSENAYAPYSKFYVGTSLRMEDNSIILGSNQENIAYPSGLCAERVALFYAGSNYPNLKIKKICVVAKGEIIPKENWISPCGSCRQVMIESQNRQYQPIEIILVSQNSRVLVFQSVSDLLPFAFNQ